jgi:hypothetical protein
MGAKLESFKPPNVLPDGEFAQQVFRAGSASAKLRPIQKMEKPYAKPIATAQQPKLPL